VQGGGTLRIVGSLIVLSAICLGLNPLAASSFVERSVSELTPDSRYVYRVRVIDREVKERDGVPMSYFTLEVLEVFKGRRLANPYAKVELPGGLVDDVGLHISGLPELARDQDYILFLQEPLKSGEYSRLTDWAAFLVSEDQSGERYVMRAPEQQRPGRRSDVRAIHQVGSLQSYEDFVGEIYWNY